MRTVSLGLPISIVIAAMVLGFGIGMPTRVHAQGENIDAVANAQCMAEVIRRKAQKPPIPPPPSPPFPCAGPHTSGQCMGAICKSEKFNAGAGNEGGASGLDQVMKALGDLFGKLMQGGGGGGSPPPSTPPTGTGGVGGTGCQGSYFQTSDISQISNPCAQYTPAPIVIDPTSEECTPLNQALGICTTNPGNCPDVPTITCNAGSHPVSGGLNANGCVLPDTCVPNTSTATTTPATTTVTTAATLPRVIFATSTNPNAAPLVMLPPGARGDIVVGPTGATVVGGTRDTQNNVEVAGFYGSETFGGQGTGGLVGEWCKSRPWANNFLSKVVAPSFFDGLCSWRGYQVGAPPSPTPAVVLQQSPKPASGTTKPAPTTTKAATTTTSTVTPKVDIWAVPASVPIGGRTSIFWNTQGVTECTETSPDGGFNQSSLSGGAATQPITAATTFSISCLAPDGSHVTGSVTVNLKI